MSLPQKLSALFGGALLAVGIVAPASAVTVGMEAVNATAPGLDLQVEIPEVDSDTVRFAFTNTSTGDAAGSALARPPLSRRPLPFSNRVMVRPADC